MGKDDIVGLSKLYLKSPCSQRLFSKRKRYSRLRSTLRAPVHTGLFFKRKRYSRLVSTLRAPSYKYKFLKSKHKIGKIDIVGLRAAVHKCKFLKRKYTNMEDGDIVGAMNSGLKSTSLPMQFF